MKDEIRRQMRLARNNFKGAEREEADRKTADNFLSVFGGHDSYFVYNSFGSETDTLRIISSLLNSGKRVYIPRVEGNNIVPVLYGATVKGAFGISEPLGQAFTGDIDITVIPLLAVNGRGFRAGYGRGFYDRYLKNAKTVKVGLCYGFQITEFKEDIWDESLDCLVTENGVVEFK